MQKMDNNNSNSSNNNNLNSQKISFKPRTYVSNEKIRIIFEHQHYKLIVEFVSFQINAILTPNRNSNCFSPSTFNQNIVLHYQNTVLEMFVHKSLLPQSEGKTHENHFKKSNNNCSN